MDEEEAFNVAAGPSSRAPHDGTGINDTASSEVKNGESMSKSAKKKAARLARMAELKPIKRKEEKEKRQARHRYLTEGYAKGTLTEEEKALYEGRKARDKNRKAAKKRDAVNDTGLYGDGVRAEGGKGKEKAEIWGGAVIIDLGFDSLMSEGEIKSMASQLSFTYSSNRLASIPFSSIIHTSASSSTSPALFKKLENIELTRWGRCHWYTNDLEDFVQRWNNSTNDTSAESANDDAWRDLREKGNWVPEQSMINTQKLVYLSADSEEELTELKEDEIYIIGGVVDRNRYKNMCQEKAEKLGIRTARLPIGTFIQNLPTRKVLTVNQVFAILIEWIAKRDWKVAFETVIPPRKFNEKKRKRGKGGRRTSGSKAEASDEEESGEVDEEEEQQAAQAENAGGGEADEEEGMNA